MISALSKEKMRIIFPDLEINAKEIIETESYKALQKIKEIIQDSSLDDKECFMKIEEIVCIFEALGGTVLEIAMILDKR